MTCIHPLSIQVCLLPTISLPHHLLYYHQAKLQPFDPHPPLPESSLDWPFFPQRIKGLISAVLGQSAFTTKLPHNTHKTPNSPARESVSQIAFGIPPFLTEMYPAALINSSHQYKNAFVCQFTRACIPYKYYRSFPEA